MSKTKRIKTKHIRTFALVVLVVLLLILAFLLLKNWEERRGLSSNGQGGTPDKTVQHNGHEYVLKEDIETVLVIGLDKFSGDTDNTAYNNDKNADFLMLLVFDHANKTVDSIQINRDTMAEINRLGVSGNSIGTITAPIALSHTQGNGKEVSCRNTADAVSKLLMNIRINHYMSLSMDAVKELNDYVGGVEVTVLDDFSGIDDTLVKDQTVTLLGDQALTYIRTRAGLEDSSNVNRMNRQRQYMQALYEKTMQRISESDEFVVKAYGKVEPYLVTDCTPNKLQTLLKKVSEYTAEDIQLLEGESVRGEEYMEFYPDANSIKDIVVNTFYKIKK